MSQEQTQANCTRSSTEGYELLSFLGSTRRGVDRRDREVNVPLYSALGRLHAPMVWSPQYKKDRELLERVQRRARLRELGLFSLEKRKLQGDLIAAFQYQKGAHKQEGSQLLEKVDNSSTRGNGLKVKEGRLRLDVSEW